MATSFTQKRITVQFDMANGQFEGGGNTYEASGLRISCVIVNVGAGSGSAEIAIWGLPLSVMNQLSTVGTQAFQIYKNGISVLAGDDETGQNVVWTGAIVYAYVDAQNMPDVCMRISSSPGNFQAAKPIPPISIKGSADAAQLMSSLAGQMGLGFENNGVNVQLANPYYPGTAWTQALAIAKHGNFDVGFDRGTMVITPPGKHRQGDVPLISADTGMVSYPMFQEARVIVRALYSPAVKYQGLVEIKSDLTPACGQWKVINITYQLECMMPHGKWFMILECINAGDQSPP